MCYRKTWLSILSIAAAWLPLCLVSAADRMHMIIVRSITVAGAGIDSMHASVIHSDWITATKTNGRLIRVVQDRRPGNRDKVFKAIEQLGKVGERDIVVFYYTGHGAIDERKGHYLTLDDFRETITRDELRQALRDAGGRLTVILTDCCAEVVNLKGHGEAYALDPPEVARQVSANLARLFAYSGVVDINSSSRDQIAWGTRSGGLFTTQLKRVLEKERLTDWDSMVSKLKEATERSYAEFRQRNIQGRGQPDGLDEMDLDTVANQAKQTPYVFTLDVREENAGGGLPPPPRGVVVERVFEGSTAMSLYLNGEKMKLEKGDRILTINGRGILNAQHFGQVIDDLGEGAAVTVAVEDTNTGKILELRGRMDAGGGYRFGARVNDP